MATVLAAASDTAMRRLLRRILSPYYEVLTLDNHRLVYEAIEHDQPDLVLLDTPEACEHIRQRWKNLRIVVLTAQTDAQTVAQILNLGADDYVQAPFLPDELITSVRALLSRNGETTRERNVVQALSSADGYLTLDVATHHLCVGAQKVSLTPTECALLHQLMLHSQKVQTHRVLLSTVWGPEYVEETEYLRIYIRSLRRKVEPDPARPNYIVTQRGIGYVFRPEAFFKRGP
jgi:two-component system KDP operon response regulator KdpE